MSIQAIRNIEQAIRKSGMDITAEDIESAISSLKECRTNKEFKPKYYYPEIGRTVRCDVDYPDIKNITIHDTRLLTGEEYKKYIAEIPPTYGAWYLNAPSKNNDQYVKSVNGPRTTSGQCTSPHNVRPVLVFSMEDESMMPIGGKIRINGFVFTVISEYLALSDIYIGKSHFGKTNEYERSDIENMINKWYREQLVCDWVNMLVLRGR